MKFVSIEKIPGYYKPTDNKELIDGFIESGMRFAEVEEYPQKDAKNCANSLNQTIRNYRMFNVRAAVRKNRVFLVRDEV